MRNVPSKIKEESLINQKQRVNNITNIKSTDKEKIKIETKNFVETEPEKSLGKDNDLLLFNRP